jgi:hypothetical protein
MKAQWIPGSSKGKQEQSMQTVVSYFGILRRFGQRFGPYLILEVLLPGGTLFALLLFLHQRGKLDIRKAIQGAVLAVMRTFAGIFEQRILVPVPAKAAIRVSKSGPAIRL